MREVKHLETELSDCEDNETNFPDQGYCIDSVTYTGISNKASNRRIETAVKRKFVS